MSELPKNWVKCELGEIAQLKNGYAFKSDSYQSEGTAVIRISDINDGIVTCDDSVKVNYQSDFENFIVAYGDILIAMSGATTGKFGIYNSEQKAFQNQRVGNLKPFSERYTNKKFLYYFLFSAKREIEKRAYGGAQPNISSEKIETIDFLLPPLNEQKRIVGKIEELFSELDKGIENLKTAREQLKVYRQSVLKQAFEGKLTATWREQNKDKLESADQLLTRIKKEREEHYQQQLKEWNAAVKAWEKNGKEVKKPSKPKSLDKITPLEKEDLELLPKLPQGWGWIKLLSISKGIQIGPFGSLLHKHDYVNDGLPLVNPSHIKNQRIEPDYSLTVTKEKLKELANYVLQESDIIIGRRGEMGRCAVVTSKEAGWLCGTGSLFVRLLDGYNPWFYCQILSSQRSKDYLSSSSIGTTMQNLNQKILYEMPVPTCSIEEQLEIIQEVQKQFSVAEQLEQTIDSELQKSEALRQSILKKAFSGQLVAQDPADEPASALLERIRLEKEANKPTKAGKKPKNPKASKPTRKNQEAA